MKEPDFAYGYDVQSHTFWARCDTCRGHAAGLPAMGAAYNWARLHTCEQETT